MTEELAKWIDNTNHIPERDRQHEGWKSRCKC